MPETDPHLDEPGQYLLNIEGDLIGTFRTRRIALEWGARLVMTHGDRHRTYTYNAVPLRQLTYVPERLAHA